MIMQGYYDDHAGINTAVKRRRMRDMRKWRKRYLPKSVSSIYIWSENLVAESEAKDGGN